MTAPIRPAPPKRKRKITPDDYRKYLQEGYTPEEIAEEAEVVAPSIGGSILQGVPVVGTWMDEAEGVASGTGRWLAGKVKGTGESWRDAVADEQARAEKANTQMPALSVASGLVSGGAAARGLTGAARTLAGGAPTSGYGNAFANYVSRAAKGVGAGATAGAVAGAGADSESRTTGALVGGALGAVAGAIPAAVEGVSRGRQFAGNFLRNRTPERRAARDLAMTMQADRRTIGQTPVPGGTVADASGRFTRRLFEDALGVPTEASTDFAEQMAAREAGRPERVLQALEQATGTPRNIRPGRAARALRESMVPQVDEAYDAARNAGAVLDDAELVRRLNETPDGQRAVAFARRKMANRREVLPEVERVATQNVPWHSGVDVPMEVPAGTEQVPNLQLVDYAKRYLDKGVTSALRKGELDRASELIQTREQIVDRAEELVPDALYQTARLRGREQQALRQAFALGQSSARTQATDMRDHADMLQRLIPGRSSAETQQRIRDAYRQGVAASLYQRASRARDGQRLLGELTGAPNSEAMVRAAARSPQAAQQLEAALANEMRMLPAEGMAAGASVHPAFESADALGFMTPYALGRAIQGNPELALAQGVGSVSRNTERAINRDAAAYLARLAAAQPTDATARQAARTVRSVRKAPEANRRLGDMARIRAEKYRPVFTEMARAASREQGRKE